MVDWPNSLNARSAAIAHCAAAMKEAGYDEPSALHELSADELMQMFQMKRGVVDKVCRYFANQAPPPPPMPPYSASSSSFSLPQPSAPAASTKQSLAQLAFRWDPRVGALFGGVCVSMSVFLGSRLFTTFCNFFCLVIFFLHKKRQKKLNPIPDFRFLISL
jgi:hypothetical protein